MLRYSDNVAYDMLVYLFGTYGFNQMVSGWGYNVALGTPSPRWPNITAAFMQKSMHEMYIHRNDGDSWRTAWKALNESTDVLVRGVLGESGKTPVAIKYGLVEYVYHEVCFIDGESPYILVILSGASGYQCDAGFVKKVAECAGRIVSEKLPVRRELGSYTAASRITGDIDLDNKADVKDLIILKKILFSEQKMNSLSRHSADINRDGQINILDMNALKRIMINTK